MSERRVFVVTDAAADLPSSEVLKARFGVGEIPQIPLRVTFGKDLDMVVDRDFDHGEFKRRISLGQIPTTAALGQMDFLKMYESLNEGGMEVVSIHLGDNLSATGGQARLAAEEISKDGVGIYNSGTVSMAQGLMAIEAEKAAAKGADQEEVVQILDEMKERTVLRAITPNFEFLIKSGRVKHIIGGMGRVLDLKPVLQIDQGVVNNVAKPRTMNRALDWMVGFVRDRGKLLPEQVIILDFEAEDYADDLVVRLNRELGVSKETVLRGPLGPITSSHGGPGTIGMAVMWPKSN
jgi:DegV family protein with EDD domain